MTSGLNTSLHQALGLTIEEINKIIIRAPRAYKTYTIPKRSSGVRTIAQPARETKHIQRWLINNIFKELPIHPCTTAYKENGSIRLNASAHQKNPYLVKLDIKNFFYSVTEQDLIQHFSLYLRSELSTKEIRDIARLSCIKPKGEIKLCLSIGAPSSPILSNSILYEFDTILATWCLEKQITYTRYADDLTFSTRIKGICSEIEPFVSDLLEKINYPSLKINKDKSIHTSKKSQRRITGVVLANTGELSLGRQKKRSISAQIHQFSLNLLSEDEIYKLQGLLGFAHDIEPIFIKRMNEKYGETIIKNLLTKRKQKQASQ